MNFTIAYNFTSGLRLFNKHDRRNYEPDEEYSVDEVDEDDLDDNSDEANN